MRTDNPPGEAIRKITLADYNRQYNYLLKVARDCQKSTALLFRNNDSALPLIDLLDREGESIFETLLADDSLEPWQVGKVKALQTHFGKLPQLTSFAALQRIVRYMGYGEYLNEQRSDTGKLDILLALANQTPELGPFLLRLQDLRELVEHGAANPDCPFLLSTIHGSKGLEYDRVLLIDVMDGVFPSVEAPRGGDELSEEEQAALEEERRLFYVGVTRAKHQLEVLTYGMKFGEASGAYSTFIAQLLGEEKREQAAPAPPTLRRAPVER